MKQQINNHKEENQKISTRKVNKSLQVKIVIHILHHLIGD